MGSIAGKDLPVATDLAADRASEGATGALPDRRTRGSMREVGILAWPIVLQMSAETLMQLINSALVGRLGATELGAVGFGGIWVWTLLTPFYGCAMGVQVFVAQEDGAGKVDGCGNWVWQGLYALVPACVLWTIVVAFSFESLVALIGPSPELQEQSVLYAQVRFLGVPLVVAGGVITSFFRGLGNTRAPMMATLVSVVAHVPLAYGLILGRLGLPALGITGAGVAIVSAELVYLGILLAMLLSRRNRSTYATRPGRINGREIRRLLRTSAPIGGQWLLDMTSFALFTSIVARMGDAEMAASQAMLQLLSLSWMQASGIGTAAGTLVGRYVGARDLDSAARSYGSALKLGMILVGFAAVLFLSMPELLMRVFSSDPEVLALARPLLLLGAFFQVIDATVIVTMGALRGGGDTRWPFVVQATLAWMLRIPLVWLAAVTLDGGVVGAWVGETGYLFVLAIAIVWRFRAGRWRSIRI